MMSGVTPAHSCAKKRPVRPMPVWISSKISSSPCSSQSAAQVAQLLGRHRADAALALDRLDQDRRGLRADRRLERLEVAERHLVEAFDLRPKAFEVFRLAAGGERRQRAAVEGALEGDDAKALGPAVHIVIAARRLDGAFDRLGAGIAEEHAVGEGRRDELLAELALAGNLEDVGDVPELSPPASFSAATSCGCAWPSTLTAMPPMKSR